MNRPAAAPEPEDIEKVTPGYLGNSPPPGQLPEKGQRIWVDRTEQLLQAASILNHSHIIAIDAEFAQVRTYTQGEVSSHTHRLALLQLAIDGYCYVVDALRLHDLSPLAPIVAHPETTILLHGAGADLRVMAERGLHVTHYYDLEATSRALFGQHESSLAAMLQRALSVRLDKSLQRTDWTRRPLPPAMIAYAARDAEMTLALYYWLNQHYSWALKLYDSANLQEPVAAWIEPFLRGSSPVPPEVVVAEALQHGSIVNLEQVYQDCKAALASLTYPMRRSRLLRLIADLSLTQLVPDIIPLLQAPTSDERSAAIRALGRLAPVESKDLIRSLLHDPVHDVRKAAYAALRSSAPKEKAPWAAPTKTADGARSWSVGNTDEVDENGESDWKARLRSILGE